MRSLEQRQIQGPIQGQIQKLILSPQMQQALHLLQLPVLELTTLIDQELETNPLLEYSSEEEPSEREENEESLDPETFTEENEISFSAPKKGEEERTALIENRLTVELSLFEHLMLQAQERFSKEQLGLAEAILGNLDARGFLSTSLEEISLLNDFDLETLKALLKEIQTFEPLGIGARNLQHSLLMQLEHLGKEQTLAYRIVKEHFEDLLQNKIPLISRALHLSAHALQKEIQEHLKSLHFHPGSLCSSRTSQQHSSFITPDVVIREEGEDLAIEVNEESIPALKINFRYLKMLEDPEISKATRDYIEEKIHSGKWLLRNIRERNQTLLRIAKQLAEEQSLFLRSPLGSLHPLTMKSLAEKLQLHESTIARAVANKYMSCPRGLYPLRSFFTHAYITQEGNPLSSKTVKEILQELVSHEDKSAPLSDEALSALIKERGIPCARRTIAKYRKELGLGSAAQRKIYTLCKK